MEVVWHAAAAGFAQGPALGETQAGRPRAELDYTYGARVLAGLGPAEDVLAWAFRHLVPIRPARGTELVLASAPVLAFASEP